MPYAFLGIENNEILREEQKRRVQHFKEARLGWSTAFSVAAKFRNGKPCKEGEGSGAVKNRSTVEGDYNVCYWVQVDSEAVEWVVRFPKMGMMDDKLALLRLRSEIAVLKFVHSKTKIPVPMVIGYGEGDDGFPPFMVMESISGIRMDLLHDVNPPERYIEAIMEDLARIQLELYSHPFDRIGMLDLPDVEECIVQGKDHIPSLTPFSIDSWEIVRNGVILPPASTFLSSTDYYDYKLGLWAHQLETQRNSVDETDDGKRKFLNVGILSKFKVNLTTIASDQPERFYLTHPDLHSSNVILDKKTLRVNGIVDWEGACTLPLSNWLILPPALTSCYKYDLHPGSSQLAAFDRRTLRYTEILLDLHRQEGLDHGGQQTLLIDQEHPDFMANVFLIRALDDTRCLDHMIWQHLAPHWYPELGTRIAAAIHPTDDVISDACYDSIKEIIHEFVEQQGTLLPERDRWLQRKLEQLRKYEEELEIMDANQDGNIDQK